MARIAILAFGSLIEDPGEEISALERERVEGVRTPFRIEFARSSGSRDGAPTLVPVDVGGSEVDAVLLVLDDEVALDEAKNVLWRRETHQVSSGKTYSHPQDPGPNKVVVESLRCFHGCDVALYTRIGANIEPLNADTLADLAIKSARGDAGAAGKDGIGYLASAIRQGISTPLLPCYEAAILRKTGARDLEEARARIREGLVADAPPVGPS